VTAIQNEAVLNVAILFHVVVGLAFGLNVADVVTLTRVILHLSVASPQDHDPVMYTYPCDKLDKIRIDSQELSHPLMQVDLTKMR
jgi:hypothetical protein